MTKIARQHNIYAKILSKGYCCVYGYLKLGQKEGLKPLDMMTPLGFSRITFYHHARKLQDGKHTCGNRPGCLKACFDPTNPAATGHGIHGGVSPHLGSVESLPKAGQGVGENHRVFLPQGLQHPSEVRGEEPPAGLAEDDKKPRDKPK